MGIIIRANRKTKRYTPIKWILIDILISKHFAHAEINVSLQMEFAIKYSQRRPLSSFSARSLKGLQQVMCPHDAEKLAIAATSIWLFKAIAYSSRKLLLNLLADSLSE
jgi:hypothetical protein